jgi:hypothetical protein
MDHDSHRTQRTTATSNYFRYPGETDNHFRQRCRRGYRDCAETYHLFRFSWQIFGHATFAQTKISSRKRLHMLHAALRSTYIVCGLSFRTAIWVRCEETRQFGRAAPHFHFLIAAIPKRIDVEKFCRRLKSEWRRVGGGLCKITPYDPTLDGAGYIAKRAGGFNGFSRENCGLTFSPSAFTYLKRTAERGAV